MPNRILREGIIDSRAVNALSEEAELFYRRLFSIVDDFGRFEANVTLLRAKLFAFRLDSWPEDRVSRVLQECSEVYLEGDSEDDPLVRIYEVGRKKYLQVSNFNQRTRTDSKFPAPGSDPAKKRAGCIYFIQAERSKKIKIGYTEVDPLTRLATLQTGSSEKLSLLGSFPGTPKDERDSQLELHEDRLEGEWFSPTWCVLAHISRACGVSLTNVSNAPPNADKCADFPPSRARPRSEAESEAEASAGELARADETRPPKVSAREASGVIRMVRTAGPDSSFPSDCEDRIRALADKCPDSQDYESGVQVGIEQVKSSMKPAALLRDMEANVPLWFEAMREGRARNKTFRYILIDRDYLKRPREPTKPAQTNPVAAIPWKDEFAGVPKLSRTEHEKPA